MASGAINDSSGDHVCTVQQDSACSLEIISQISQSFSSVFLLQKIS
jgi:hypothetical protein